MAVARAAREGLEIAKKNGVDISKWRAVITHMLGRLTERKELAAQAEYAGVDWTDADRKWFGIGVFKRACQILRDEAFPSKMLMCSVRSGPVVNGRMRYWDIEEFAGADVVFTLPPVALEPLFALDANLEFHSDAIDMDIPESTLEKMMKIPYCIQSYESERDVSRSVQHPPRDHLHGHGVHQGRERSGGVRGQPHGRRSRPRGKTTSPQAAFESRSGDIAGQRCPPPLWHLRLPGLRWTPRFSSDTEPRP